MSKLKLVLTSVATSKEAELIAKELVSLKLTVCVQMSAAGKSVYRWKDEICADEEFYLQIKTNKKHLKAVVAWLENNHPYGTPEIITLNAKASRGYHDWLSTSLNT